jgi:hypothetical protein
LPGIVGTKKGGKGGLGKAFSLRNVKLVLLLRFCSVLKLRDEVRGRINGTAAS